MCQGWHTCSMGSDFEGLRSSLRGAPLVGIRKLLRHRSQVEKRLAKRRWFWWLAWARSWLPGMLVIAVVAFVLWAATEGFF